MHCSDIGIIGYGSSLYEKVPGLTEAGYLARAGAAALASAGLDWADVDGLTVSSTTLHPDNAVTLAEHFGLMPRWTGISTSGGAGSNVNVLDAIQAVQSGRAQAVLCLAGSAQDAAYFRSRVNSFNRAVGDYLAPHGIGGMNSLFGMVQRRHMEEFGTTRAQLGRLSVAQRYNGARNPRALLNWEISLQDYLDAPVIADPLCLYDCVMPCSGAEAVVVSALDRGAEGRRVRVVGSGERHNYPTGDPTPLHGGWASFRDAMYDEAGFGPGDADFLQAYDDYPIMVAIQMEDLGFCEKGAIGALLERRDLTHVGDLPVNTGGGQLGCGQAGGAGGMIGITEAICQLFGEGGARQVPQARRGIVSGYGMVSYGHGLSATALALEAT